MGCTIDKDLIEKTIEFHGHTCPGLAIGIRVSELAMKNLDIIRAKGPVCVVETDMCAVDAVQYLTGCTFGKGNLIHKDYGKSGFSFFDRKTNRGFRALFKEEFRQKRQDHDQLRLLMQKIGEGSATEEEKEHAMEYRKASEKRIMDADLKDLFSVEELSAPPVRPARILESLECHECKEMTMESRTRRIGGNHYCIPCFMTKEQKV